MVEQDGTNEHKDGEIVVVDVAVCPILRQRRHCQACYDVFCFYVFAQIEVDYRLHNEQQQYAQYAYSEEGVNAKGVADISYNTECKKPLT